MKALVGFLSLILLVVGGSALAFSVGMDSAQSSPLEENFSLIELALGSGIDTMATLMAGLVGLTLARRHIN